LARADHPDYDPRTIFVPEADMAKMSPGQRQYWQLKAENWDVVLFFKMVRVRSRLQATHAGC
jgi:DNA mismatch repair protein MSH6